jgi:hypothetical protein
MRDAQCAMRNTQYPIRNTQYASGFPRELSGSDELGGFLREPGRSGMGWGVGSHENLAVADGLGERFP